jgi:argininosuccinate lyase
MIESWMHSTGRALPPLLRRLGHDYVLLTRDPGLYPADADGPPHRAVAHAAEVVVVETNDTARTIAASAAVARRRPVDGVLTTCDYYLEGVARVARALGLPGEDPDALATARRKDRVRAAVAAAGIPDVRHAVVADDDAARKAGADLGYPLVAKPVDGNSGAGVRLVHDEDQLADVLTAVRAETRNGRGQTRAGLLLLEEILDGQEVSVETVTVRGRTTVLAVTDKSLTGMPAFVESGHMVSARLSDGVRRAAEEHVRDALAAVGLRHGLAHTELRLTADGPRLVEINPRQGGNSIFELLDLVVGVHPLRLLVDLALGGEPALPTEGTEGSASIMFVISPEAADIVAVEGTDTLPPDPHVLRWHVRAPARASEPRDNGCYLGEVVTVDRDGPGARAAAEAAIDRLRLRTSDGRLLRPLGVPSGLA